MQTEYLKYYDLENYILTDVRANFKANGHLNSFDFFCIIIWKANRAKSKIANRLLKADSNLDRVVRGLTSKIFVAEDNKEKLRLLMEDYGFRLPMASAILSLLYPNDFTIYDVRVCETFPEYKKLDNLIFENLWKGYCNYIESVRNYGSQKLSLREKDRLLWSKSFYEQLQKDIKSNFNRNQ